MELLSNLSLSSFLSRFYLFVMDQIVIESLYYRFQAGGVRYETQDSTNQNALFVEWFSRSGRAFFRGVHDEIFALFQACVGTFGTIPPWKVVGTLYLDSSYVGLKYFAFLSVCDKFELLGHGQSAMVIWVLFSPFFLASLLVTVGGFIGLFWSSCYFNLSFFVNVGVYPGLPLLVFPLWDIVEWRDRLSQEA